VPVFVLDTERQIVFFNRACEELTGRTAEQMRGLSCRYFGPAGANDLPELGASLCPPPEVFQGQPMTAETWFSLPNAQRLCRHIRFTPCHDGAGKLIGVLGLISDRADHAAEPPAPHIELHNELHRLRDRLYRRFGFDKIVSASAAMVRVMAQARVACQCDANVLIVGEPGTGKTLVARTIHQESARREAPFLPIDCALLPAAVLERDLFGSESGDSPRRASDRPGLVRRAASGTIFLKNVRQLPRDLQGRLIESLHEVATKSPSSGTVDSRHVRLIAADETDISQPTGSGELRADFCCALSTIVINLPPLRDRKDDQAVLAQMFVETANSRGVKQLGGMAPAAVEVLLAYDWPENVRELSAVITDAHARCDGNFITPEDLTPRIQGALGGIAAPPPPSDRVVDLDAVLIEAERKLIEHALKKSRGNKSQAAELLTISRAGLLRRMQRLGLDAVEFKQLPAPEAVNE